MRYPDVQAGDGEGEAGCCGASTHEGAEHSHVGLRACVGVAYAGLSIYGPFCQDVCG